jgi:acetyltransferase-like isoleucine patch superfamily enzyme
MMRGRHSRPGAAGGSEKPLRKHDKGAILARLRRVASGKPHSVRGRIAYKLHQRVAWDFELSLAEARRQGVRVADGVNLYGEISWGSEPWLVSIGAGTEVTNGVSFITHDGSIRVIQNGPFAPPDPSRLNRYGAIAIGENCFIGTRAVIVPGVRIGDHSIVGAAAVVTKDVERGRIVAGNPARVVGTVEDFARKVERESLDIPGEWDDLGEWRRVVEETVWERDRKRHASPPA